MRNYFLIIGMFFIFTQCTTDDVYFEEYDQDIGYTYSEYVEMIKDLKDNIDLVLAETKPIDLTMNDYKIMLLKGEMSITDKQYEKISILSEEISNYGKSLIKKYDLDLDIGNSEQTIAIGGLYSPNDNFIHGKDTKYQIFNPTNNLLTANKLTGKDFLACAAVAIGADAIWALGGSAASSWTIAAMTRAFAAIAKRFLGPVGVAIAVTSFGVCLADRY